MDVVTLAAARSASVPWTDAGRRYRDSLARGLMPVTTRPNSFTLNSSNQSNGTDTSGNYRYKHQVLVTATGIRLVYGNFYNGGQGSMPNAITVKASIEFPDVSGGASNTGQVGAKIAVSFGGVRSATIDPDCFVVSDPIPVTLVAGHLLYTRTYVSVASAGMKWPLDLFTKSGDWEGATRGAPASDLTGTSGIAQTTESGYGPLAILGSTAPSAIRTPVVGIVGDSIGYGSGDSFNNGLGFVQRALAAANVPYLQFAKPGEKSSDILTSGLLNGQPRWYLLNACTHVVEQYGQNDRASSTLAQLQANKLNLWTDLARRGIKVWATTNSPNTTSTDAWATLANQTVTATEAIRTGYNDWLRGGAPISAGVAVAVGTAGALLAGQAGHPLTGYFECADLAESARNSGKFRVDLGTPTSDGTHPSGAIHTAMSAGITTASFT